MREPRDSVSRIAQSSQSYHAKVLVGFALFRSIFAISIAISGWKKLERASSTRIRVADSLEAPGTSKRFQILYRNEEVTLGTSVLFRAHVLVHSHKIEEALSRTHFNLGVELWFSEPTQPGNMACVSSR